jgi:alkanesulfonate monooxygenase SsuD/methylene tetrahydromethanopterin reductase-like flavin-dependent oxidoreductase (luciferase family)
MEIGIFNLVQKRKTDLPAEETFKAVLEQVRMAEDMGMDTAWIAEHHFSTYSISVSPLMVAAWLAGQTKRIRLAPGVLVLPLYHPLRVIQEYEMLNLMTNNRVDFGIGTGYQNYEFERFEVPLEEAEERSLELMDIFHQAVETGGIKHSGKYFKVPECQVAVRSTKKNHRVYAAGGLNFPRFPREIIRKGYIPFLTPSWGPIDTVVKQRAFIDKIAGEEGVDPKNVPLAIMRFVHVTNSKEEAMEAAECLRYSSRAALSLRFNYSEFDGATPKDIAARDEPSVEDIVRNAIIGDAETCAEKIVNEARLVRATQFACSVNVGSLDPKKTARSMERLGAEVLPSVRKAMKN